LLHLKTINFNQQNRIPSKDHIYYYYFNYLFAIIISIRDFELKFLNNFMVTTTNNNYEQEKFIVKSFQQNLKVIVLHRNYYNFEI